MKGPVCVLSVHPQSFDESSCYVTGVAQELERLSRRPVTEANSSYRSFTKYSGLIRWH